jgi:hypothetical protein
MDYGQTSGTYLPNKNPTPGVTVDKVCKLLRAGQPIVWAVAIVFGLLGVSLTIHYLWKRNRVDEEERTAHRPVPNGNSWMQT